MHTRFGRLEAAVGKKGTLLTDDQLATLERAKLAKEPPADLFACRYPRSVH